MENKKVIKPKRKPVKICGTNKKEAQTKKVEDE